jgi:hypothetical protein
MSTPYEVNEDAMEANSPRRFGPSTNTFVHWFFLAFPLPLAPDDDAGDGFSIVTEREFLLEEGFVPSSFSGGAEEEEEEKKNALGVTRRRRVRSLCLPPFVAKGWWTLSPFFNPFVLLVVVVVVVVVVSLLAPPSRLVEATNEGVVIFPVDILWSLVLSLNVDINKTNKREWGVKWRKIILNDASEGLGSRGAFFKRPQKTGFKL